jgi:hypothetical protein
MTPKSKTTKESPGLETDKIYLWGFNFLEEELNSLILGVVIIIPRSSLLGCYHDAKSRKYWLNFNTNFLKTPIDIEMSYEPTGKHETEISTTT